MVFIVSDDKDAYSVECRSESRGIERVCVCVCRLSKERLPVGFNGETSGYSGVELSCSGRK